MSEEKVGEATEKPTEIRRAKNGRPLNGKFITKETAKQYAANAARMRKLRREQRAKMLVAMCENLDIGAEIVTAIKTRNESHINVLEKALKLTGLTHDQSPDAIAQKVDLTANANVKKDSTVKLVIEDFTLPEKTPKE